MINGASKYRSYFLVFAGSRVIIMCISYFYNCDAEMPTAHVF